VCCCRCFEKRKHLIIFSVKYDNTEDSSWLDDYWDDGKINAIIPETSTSSDLRGGKKIKRT
jgi:hypothetical protein